MATDALRGAIATVTAWLDDDRSLALTIAAQQVDEDAIGFLHAMGGLWTVVADVVADPQTDTPDVAAVIHRIALGVAQAELEDRA
ncbi:MAG: hypothetical protein JJT89_06125 [Nitriliruptoraceae bacterium]|nr:hypothetical protein [Nitriliruptoraceae bacterium]